MRRFLCAGGPCSGPSPIPKPALKLPHAKPRAVDCIRARRGWFRERWDHAGRGWKISAGEMGRPGSYLSVSLLFSSCLPSVLLVRPRRHVGVQVPAQRQPTRSVVYRDRCRASRGRAWESGREASDSDGGGGSALDPQLTVPRASGSAFRPSRPRPPLGSSSQSSVAAAFIHESALSCLPKPMDASQIRRSLSPRPKVQPTECGGTRLAPVEAPLGDGGGGGGNAGDEPEYVSVRRAAPHATISLKDAVRVASWNQRVCVCVWLVEQNLYLFGLGSSGWWCQTSAGPGTGRGSAPVGGAWPQTRSGLGSAHAGRKAWKISVMLLAGRR